MTTHKDSFSATSTTEWRVVYLLRRLGSVLRSGVDAARLQGTGTIPSGADAAGDTSPAVLDAVTPRTSDDSAT